MAEYNQYVTPIDFSAGNKSLDELIKPRPSPLDKILEYMGGERKRRSENIDYQKKQQGWADEQELKKIQNELAASFKANRPKDAREFIQRSMEANIKAGKLQQAEQMQVKLDQMDAMAEAKKAELAQKLALAGDANKLKTDALKVKLYGIAIKSPEEFAKLSPAMGMAGITPDVAADMIQAAKDKSTGKLASNRYQLIDKYAKDPVKKEQITEFLVHLAGAEAGAKAEAGAPYNSSRYKLVQDENGNMKKVDLLADGGALPVVEPPPPVEPPATAGINYPPEMAALANQFGASSMGMGNLIPPSSLGDTTLLDPALMPLNRGDGSEVPPGFTQPVVDPGAAKRVAGVTDLGFKGPEKTGTNTDMAERRLSFQEEKAATDNFRTAWKNNMANKEWEKNLGAWTKADAMEMLQKRSIGTEDYFGQVARHSLMYQYLRALDNSVVKPSEIAAFRALGGVFNNPAVLAAMDAWKTGMPFNKKMFDALQISTGEMRKAIEAIKDEAKRKFVSNVTDTVKDPEQAKKILRQVWAGENYSKEIDSMVEGYKNPQSASGTASVIPKSWKDIKVRVVPK